MVIITSMFSKWTVLTKALRVNIRKEKRNIKGADKKLDKEKKWAHQPPLPEDIVSFLDRPSRGTVHYTSQLRKNNRINTRQKYYGAAFNF